MEAKKALNGAELLKVVQSGRPFFVGEFRGFSRDVVKYSERATGKAKSFTKMTCLFETAEPVRQVSVNLFDREGEPPNADPSVKKGTICLVQVEELVRERGAVSVTTTSDGIVPLV